MCLQAVISEEGGSVYVHSSDGIRGAGPVATWALGSRSGGAVQSQHCTGSGVVEGAGEGVWGEKACS